MMYAKSYVFPKFNSYPKSVLARAAVEVCGRPRAKESSWSGYELLLCSGSFVSGFGRRGDSLKSSPDVPEYRKRV